MPLFTSGVFLISHHATTINHESAKHCAHQIMERYSFHKNDSILATSTSTHLERR